MACLGRLSIHLVHAILAWFREAEVLAPAIPEWAGTRALIDPFPPPPLKLLPPPDISMASDRITMAMPWAIAPSPLLVDGSVPIWFTDSTHALLSSGLPLILVILIGWLLYARCSVSACGPIDFDRASSFSGDVSVRRSERSRVGPLPPRLNYRSTAINDSRKASPHYEQLGKRFSCCRRAPRRNIRICRQCLLHLRRVRLSELVLARRQHRQRSNAPKGWIAAVVHRLKDFFGRRSLQGAAVSFALIALCVAGFHLADGSVAVVASMNRSFDQILDFKDAFWFGCWDALQEGERILTCICDWLIEKLFGSFWGAIALVLFGLLTWPLASSIRSLPLYSPWVADRLWQIVVLFWPQQLLNFFIAWPLVGYAAIVGLVFYSILCVVVQLCHRLFAWDTIKNGFVEIGIAFKFRISFRIEKVDGHGAKLNDNRYRLVDSSDDLQVKIAKQQDRIEEPNAATVDYQRLYEELRKQHKQDQKAVGQDAVPKDVGPRHKNIDDLSISTKSYKSRQENDLAITHGDYTPVSDIKQSIHTHGTSESVESRRELAYLRRTSKFLAAQLDDREKELKAEKETSAQRAVVDRANLTSLAAAERTVANLSEQLKDLRGSLDVSLERVGELENELHTARGELETARGELGTARGELGTARGELESHAAEAAKATNKALASFNKTFPGGFDIIPTADTDAQCGFYAVIESIKAMNLFRTTQPLPVPSCAELLAAYKSHDVQQSCREWCAGMEFSDKDTTAELGRTGFFSIEQVFQALDHWASTEHGGLKVSDWLPQTTWTSGAGISAATTCRVQA